MEARAHLLVASGGMASVTFRAAGPQDSDGVAALHVDSWQRHYRGAFADSFLDGDVLTLHHRATWTRRLAAAPQDPARREVQQQQEPVRARAPQVQDQVHVQGQSQSQSQSQLRIGGAESLVDGSVGVHSAAESTSGAATIVAEADGELVGFIHVVFDDDAQWGSLVDNLHVVHGRKRGGIGSELLARAAQAVATSAATDLMYLWVLEQNTAAQAFYAACGGREVERTLVSAPLGDPGNLNGRPARLRYAWPDVREFRASAW